MRASLDEKMKAVKWGEYRVDNIFKPITVRRKLTKENVCVQGDHPVYSSDSENNGIVGFYEEPEFICDSENPVYVVFGDHTRTISIARKSFSVLDNVKVLRSVIQNDRILLFIISAWKRQLPDLGYNRHWRIAKKSILQLPMNDDGSMDTGFMESYIAAAEAECMEDLMAYLKARGLDDCVLTEEENDVLLNFKSVIWASFNLKNLFGKSTRGKRLKGEDRIPGTLPFVTAGEAQEGISAYIGNDVEIFEGNTTTIDMFGSAKYRSYRYGGDDHIAVVHTEHVPARASIFITAAIHKAAHTGKFDYGLNFYAKDADALDVMLPAKDGHPDYGIMSIVVSAIEKLVIRDVIEYADKKIAAARAICGSDN